MTLSLIPGLPLSDLLALILVPTPGGSLWPTSIAV